MTPGLEYLRRNHAKKATIHQEAECAKMSDSQFMKAFKQFAGPGFVACRAHWRVSNAIPLLRDPERTDPTRPTRRSNIDLVVGAVGDSIAPRWCNGSFDRAPDGGTTLHLTNSPACPSVGKVDSFQCAADRSVLRHEGRLQPRLSSYAMNAVIGARTGEVLRQDRLADAASAQAVTGPGEEPRVLVFTLEEAKP